MAHLLFVAGSSDLALEISKHFPKKIIFVYAEIPKRRTKEIILK